MFFWTTFAWESQVNSSSRCIPTNLKDSSLQPWPILSICLSSIDNFKSEKLIFRDFSPKSKYLVLDTFKVSLFALNQSESFSSYKFASLNRFFRLLEDFYRVVSHFNENILLYLCTNLFINSSIFLLHPLPSCEFYDTTNPLPHSPMYPPKTELLLLNMLLMVQVIKPMSPYPKPTPSLPLSLALILFSE